MNLICLPKSKIEIDRIHQQHWVFKVAFQGNYAVPLKEKLEEGIKVLDSGCGKRGDTAVDWKEGCLLIAKTRTSNMDAWNGRNLPGIAVLRRWCLVCLSTNHQTSQLSLWDFQYRRKTSFSRQLFRLCPSALVADGFDSFRLEHGRTSAVIRRIFLFSWLLVFRLWKNTWELWNLAVG